MDNTTMASVPDLVCFSHLRWDFVYQRPQHLLSRCARERRVFFIEEPIFVPEQTIRLDVGRREDDLWVVVPYLPEGLSADEVESAMEVLIDGLFRECRIEDWVAWYYTPMALGFTAHLEPRATVYDCMDELSAFKGAPPALREREAELFRRADVVFTGGQSLYEAKRDHHSNIHAFPSSIEREHFARARSIENEPEDQAGIPHPRLGFIGVIDERMDIELIDGIATARPDWQIVMIGPVVKIDPATLPQHPNIHYLGGRQYTQLPEYLAGWDIAMLPFARNESTRFISPTKTPEYLAAARPVVSTSIRDVVRPYGELDLVRIADTPEEFVAAADDLMSRSGEAGEWLARVDELLARNSWDQTWERMRRLIDAACEGSRQPAGAGSSVEMSDADPEI